MTATGKSGENAAASLSPLKQALLALDQAQARVRELENAPKEPIAIVGLGCRIPGGEDGVEGYWKLLREGSSAVSDGVERRLHNSLRGKELLPAARRAALLEHVDLFDPRHFGISPREAAGMDPQQRLLLEVSWEALENAGIDPFSLYQSPTGVYLGISSNDYAQLQFLHGSKDAASPHFASGIASSVAAGRISYVLGLNGPSLSIDTACSSSLVSVHLACEGLRHGDCTTAIAGGVNLILSPEPSFAFAHAGMLSVRGEVRAFDTEADGFVRGEGCGVVVLKRLKEAKTAGDRILGLILGSAVNQDGASSGLTVPNGLAQQSLLREAHRRAGIEPWQVGYVEAHGTGTTLGDPIEAEALGTVFASGRERLRKLQIGSVKTNVGHLEAAAGVAGLIKVVLSLQHKIISRQLNCETPSEHVRWSQLPLEVVTEEREWVPIEGRRIGAVSSFGFSGTNVHVVLEDWQEEARAGDEAEEEVLVVTARTESALRELSKRYAEFLVKSDLRWSDISYTAAVGRGVFGERLAIVAREKAEAGEKLRGWLRGEKPEGVYRGQVGAGRRAGTVILSKDAPAATVAKQFVQGEAIDWMQRAEGRKLRRVALPTYPFQRERYWIEEREGAEKEEEIGERTNRGLLGRRVRAAGVSGQFETQLTETSWIGEHVVAGRVVLPATGHVELMLEAGAEVFGSGRVLEDVVLQSPLVIAGVRRVQTVVEETTGGRSRVRVYGEQTDGTWERVSEGWLAVEATAEKPARLDMEEIRRRLRTVDGGETFYAEMVSRGLEFGERFRGVEKAWAGTGEALGEIVGREISDEGWQSEPWWLDACLQVSALAVKGAEDGDLYLPLNVGRLQVYGRPGERSWSHVTMQRIDAVTLSADVTIVDPDGSPLARLSGLRFRKIKTNPPDIHSWLYRLDWRKAKSTVEAQESVIREATAELEVRVHQFEHTESVSEYNAFFRELERLSAAYVLEAIRQLGWPQRGSALSMAALEDLWKIVPRHRPLFHRLLEIATETGAIRREADTFRFGSIPAPMETNLVANLSKRFPFGKTELDLVARCGASLAEVLTGKVEGRELVFPGGRSEEMARLYRDSVPARIYNEMLAEMVSRLVRVRGGAAARILEVGGGTASTTHYVLEALRSSGQSLKEYVFTDISPLLVRRAQQNFQESGSFRTHVFDLEREAKAQGIDGPFSIVLAVNVLHATTDLSATLNRLKPLLAEDGVLVLVEVIGKQRWADITVGLLEEWWSFADRHLRPDYPALERGGWQPILRDSGFERITTIPQHSEHESIFGRQELIVASGPVLAKRMLVVGQGDLAEKVALHLRQKIVLVDSVKTGEFGDQSISPTLDAVLWVAGQHEPFDNVSAGLASSAAENSICSLLATVQAVHAHRAQDPPRLYVVTSRACAVDAGDSEIELAEAPLVGLAAGIATEAPDLRCTRIDCGDEDSDSNAAHVAAEVLSNTGDQWIAWRSGERYVARLQRVQTVREEMPERVQLKTGSSIDELEYMPSPQRELQPDEVEISVSATALNFRDVLQSLGVVNLNAPLGADCAGVILRVGTAVTDLTPGDEVVAVAPGCFASHVITPRALVIRKPERVSFAEAAAQTIAYLTADFSLNEIGHVRKGERVLIHAAAGGVGLAALRICQKVGAEPIATAGSERKREFLRNLGVMHVYDSRSLEFAKKISGGVDIVLNSLAGEAIDEGLRLLKRGGRFIELGKTDLRDPRSIEDAWPGIRYLPVDLTPLFAGRSPWVAERLAELLKEIEEGSLPLLPTTVFDAVDVKTAFRYMARAEHIGRVVVQRKKPKRFSGAHLITGGLRGIGLKLAMWLAENGARRLVLLGRQPAEESAHQAIIRLKSQDLEVFTLQGDIANPEIAKKAIELAGRNLRGVWHSAGVLKNASLTEQSWDTIRSVFGPKVDGSWNLHTLTHGMPIEDFVMFSSWASIGGSYGQINHCAANAFLDGLAHFRRTKGLPALTLNWGAWGETGAAAGDEVRRQLARSGIQSMSPNDALSAMYLALKSNCTQVAVAAIDWPRYLIQHLNQMDPGFYAEILAEDAARPVQKILQRGSGARNGTEQQGPSPQSPTMETIFALPAALREAALLRTAGDIVRKTLDLHPSEQIDPDLPLSDLGMDSLLAIELQNSLSVVLHRKLPSTTLFDYPTLRTLVRYLRGEVLSITPGAPVAQAKTPVKIATIESESALGILDAIEQLSDEEIESVYERNARL